MRPSVAMLPDTTVGLAELQAAVRMCYVGEAQRWAEEGAEAQLAEEKLEQERTQQEAGGREQLPTQEQDSPFYPPEWEPRVRNLTARFADRTRDEIIDALLQSGGHGGTAAGVLQRGGDKPSNTSDIIQKQTREAVRARRQLAARLESGLAAKFGITFIRNLKRPDDRQVSWLFNAMVKEHLLPTTDYRAPTTEDPTQQGGLSGLSADAMWEILQRHSESAHLASINYDNPLVTTYGGEDAIKDDLTLMLDFGCADAALEGVSLSFSDLEARLAGTADCVLVCSPPPGTSAEGDGGEAAASGADAASSWQIPCHQTLLSARCKYFHALLVNGAFSIPSDEQQRVVLSVDSGMGSQLAMQVFVAAVYAGRLHLCGHPPELSIEVFHIAHFYQCDHVCQLCESAIVDLITLETVIDIDQWAQGHEGASWTRRQVGRWVRRHFSEIAGQPEVLAELSESRFVEAISSDFTCADDEDCVLQAIFTYGGVSGNYLPFLPHCRFPFVTEAALLALTAEQRAAIPPELLAERAAFQPLTAFSGSEQAGAAAVAVASAPSVMFVDTDGDSIEFRRTTLRGGAGDPDADPDTMVVACVVEQLVNGERVQLSVKELVWNPDAHTLLDGPGISTLPHAGAADESVASILEQLQVLCQGSSCAWKETSGPTVRLVDTDGDHIVFRRAVTGQSFGFRKRGRTDEW
eukprot:COSAG01_NODE_8965_length_2600_cov_14.135235_1_plen_691_part_10